MVGAVDAGDVALGAVSVKVTQVSTDATVYCRISSDRTGEGLGVERQKEDAHQLATARGWSVTRTLVDNDISAAGGKTRPEFESLLTDIESGAAPIVIAWNLDRLTRSRADTVRLIETCHKAGVKIALCRGSDMDLSTPSGRFTADLLAAVARQEIETKSDRQKRANQQSAEQGKPAGGPRPFGYEDDGLTIREPEAQAVRDAYQAVLDGVSFARIAEGWNQAGLVPPQPRRDGKPSRWVGGTARRCLQKPRYAGLSAIHGEAVGDAEWVGLVDRDTWYAAGAMLKNGRVSPRGDQYLLSGLALCGVCASHVHAGGTAQHGGARYRCAGSYGHVVRLRQPVDELIRDVIIARLSQPDAAALAAPTQQTTNSATLMRTANEARQRLDGISEAYAEGDIELSQLQTATKRLRAKIEDAETRLAAMDTGSPDLQAVVDSDNVPKAWDKLATEAQRRIIDRLMTVRLFPPGQGARTFRPETVGVEWKVKQ